MREQFSWYFSWESFRTTIRTAALVALFSLLSVEQSKTNSGKSDREPPSLEEKSFLDDVPILDKSLLYYFFAKNNKNEQLINEQCFVITHDYWWFIEESAAKYDIDPLLVAGVVLLESWGNPKAHSVAGAKWLMQMLRRTAAEYGWYSSNDGVLIDKRTDPAWSIDAWCRHLASLYKKFGSWSLAVAAYHMGEGNVKHKLQKIYCYETGFDLISMEMLYERLPPVSVVEFLSNRQDDTFGYYAKVRNAMTVLQMYLNDCQLFDNYVKQYENIEYDLRGIVAENVVLSHPPIATENDIHNALTANSMCLVDHWSFLCHTGETENAFHPSVDSVMHIIKNLVDFPFRISYGTISDEYYNKLDSSTKVDKRHSTHRSGYVFDIFSADLSLQERNIMMYALTILRYKWVLLWCREFRDTDREQYHVVVLPDAWKYIDNIYNADTLDSTVSSWEK